MPIDDGQRIGNGPEMPDEIGQEIGQVRLGCLLLILALLLAFAAGFFFDRWLHRPIVIQLQAHPTQHRGIAI